ncbi:MAG: molybdenum cofactor guanylyltransferase [Synergistaceae bacterium]|jgi:molybdopterin-guanine dinucleotide biosynthesis protein A|nr:molybdenum cofactor guanylyltransferase [Synergistaceae bacterium]
MKTNEGVRATAAILAGGKSRRFGSDKTTLRWGEGTILEKIARRCRCLFDEILIVGNAPGKFSIPGAEEIEDIYADAGPLGGIHAALRRAANDRVFVTACDMPFFDGALAAALLECSRGHDVAVPREGVRLQPLFAVYNRTALPEIERMLAEGERALRLLYGRVRVKCLDRDKWGAVEREDRLFFNINFPEDYRAFVSNSKEPE